MEELTREKFRDSIRFQRTTRTKGKISNSYGMYQYFCNYKKIKPRGQVEYVLLWWQYSEIIHAMHKLIIEELFNTGYVDFPYNLGTLVLLRRDKQEPKFIDGKLVFNKYVNWDATLDLWYEDEEAREDRIKVYHDLKEIYTIVFRHKYGSYKNQLFYKFDTIRGIKKEVAKRAIENKLDNFFVNGRTNS